MSYTIEDLTSIDDAIFDALWDASYDRIESGGTMPWTKYEIHYGYTLTKEGKKEILKSIFTEAVKHRDFGTKVYLTRKDGVPVRMMNYQGVEGIVHGYYQLIGPDALGSRAWLFDPVLLRLNRDRFISDFEATAHTGEAITGSSICNYYITKDNYGEYADVTCVDNDGISTITFIYL